jgi:fucose 4-O-acetylase-like acetyltransferase
VIPEPRARRHDVDWLRIGATFLLFVFHPARPFDHGPWHVKSAERSMAFDLLVWFIHQFHMPLFFTLAGWSLERSLRFRSPPVVRRERRRRLLVPFVAGVVLLSPAQAYVEAVTQSGYTGTVLIAIVPFAMVEIALRWRWPGKQNLYDDWANFAWYSLFFVGGFVVSRRPDVEELIRRGRVRSTVWFVVIVVAMLPILATHADDVFVPGVPYVAYWSLSAAAGVLGVAALLAWGRRLEDVDGPRFGYLRESLLPVYVLHQAVIVVLGYWLVRLPAPIGVRYLVLATASLTTTMALYDLVVRRVTALRILFGMPAKAAPAVV